jgi:hypothetical protein
MIPLVTATRSDIEQLQVYPRRKSCGSYTKVRGKYRIPAGNLQEHIGSLQESYVSCMKVKENIGFL